MDEIASKYQQLSVWLQTRLGQIFLEAEKKCLDSFFADFLGDTLLILGDFRQSVLVKNCQVKERLVLSPYQPECPDLDFCRAKISRINYQPLQLDQAHADVILLPHTLDFVENAEQVLHQVVRALKGEGYLIVIGFNPVSLCGLRRLFSSKTMPWSGSLRTLSRMEDWLAFLNFEIVSGQHAFYRPPFHWMAWRWLKFLDYFGRYLLSPFGGVYVLIARKRVLGVTPLKAEWEKLSSIVSKGIVEPLRHEQSR
jgi:SAM-dependent methyltransferase